ncbi:MAG: hypothetical protein A3B94_01225 [Candidatus Jacksonbacteria bacterium RIFCSPHIGHO2_02_FULL_43_10]|nr:MAG: hypothetical protein A3I58_03875 [Candidatus Peregrinibacteria bacterium RIFCSPLOWO2_02_FULL_39_10]OGY69104.1 MAG: hypothetical protein A3B94_01225 [Candidatus Jacksonbacteria bacterium RIFCSPHIGHO2_02_FULL_43_10]
MSITNSRAIREKRSQLTLTDRQKDILVGSLLGDGCLLPNAWQKHYRFQVEQSDKHKEYVFWLYREFKAWVLQPPRYIESSGSWRFRTISHPELTAVYRRFYQNGAKTVPPDLTRLLVHPLSLAIWAMDDGCLMPKQGFTFNTQSFSVEENEKLRRCLKKNFGLSHTSLHRDKDKVRLYVKRGSVSCLRDIVKPYVRKEFIYKLPLAP